MNNDIIMEQKNKLLPELRFPEFAKDGKWEIKSLDKIVNKFIVPMRDKPKKLDGEIPWCRIEDFNGMYLYGSKSNQGVSSDTVKEMNLKVYPINTLLVSCSADLGRCAITKEPLVTNQTFIGLVPNIKKVNVEYLYYVMSNSRDELNAKSSGTTISYLSRQQFEQFTTGIPQLKEQQKIAGCLSSLDELIRAHTDKLETLKNHKKGLLQNLFPQEGQKLPTFRFPEFLNNEEWAERKLGDLAENLDSKRIPITSNQREKGSIPYFGASGVIDYVKEYIFDETLLCISEDGANLIDRNYPIAFTISGKTWVNNHAHVLKFENYYTHILVEKYINSINVQDFLTGMAQPKLNRGKLDIIPIPLPKNQKEQQKIADCLLAVDNLITAQTEKIKQLKTHKKGLMQGLFPKVSE